jgi:Protein of unknown function (DUF3277)
MAIGANSGTYSFENFVASIQNAGGSFSLGSDAGSAKEGMTYRFTEEKTTTTTGAGGDIMHALKASKTGEFVFRFLKTSPVNAQLSQLYNLQEGLSGLWGSNTITWQDIVRGDQGIGIVMAFIKFPDGGFSDEGPPVQEWGFRGIIAVRLGTGTPAAVAP